MPDVPAETATLYRMVMDGHVCPFGLKAATSRENVSAMIATLLRNIPRTGATIDAPALRFAFAVYFCKLTMTGEERRCCAGLLTILSKLWRRA